MVVTISLCIETLHLLGESRNGLCSLWGVLGALLTAADLPADVACRGTK